MHTRQSSATNQSTSVLSPRTAATRWSLWAVLAACAALGAATLAHAGTITVSTAAELTSAVLDSGNDGAEIVINPGRYVLKVSLDLREGMKLRGPNAYLLDANGVPQPRPEYRDGETFADPKREAILDGSRLPGNPNALLGSPGVVVAGRNNEISGLTIIGNAAVNAAIDVVNRSIQGGARAVVSGCILEGKRRGVRLQSYDDPLSPLNGSFDGTLSTALIQGNVIRGNTEVFGFGIQVLHNETENSTWNVDVRSNRVYSNGFGIFTAMLSTIDAVTNLQSTNNVYANNVRGYSAFGGRDFPPGAGPAAGNSTRFYSQNDKFVNNVGPGGGGVIVVVARGENATSASGVSDNEVRLQFLDTTFTTGQGLENGDLNKRTFVRRDVRVMAAVKVGSATTVGPGNTASLLIRKATSDGATGAFAVQDTSANFVDPTGTDRVFIVGSDVAIERTNDEISFD